MKTCLACDKVLSRSDRRYCNNKCQWQYQSNQFIDNWLNKTGSNILTRNISKYIKRYLIDKHGEKCSVCRWEVRHPITGRVPLEVDHIDGDHTNNEKQNLRLLCPNCHSLTVNFRNLNNGNGRTWRRKLAQES